MCIEQHTKQVKSISIWILFTLLHNRMRNGIRHYCFFLEQKPHNNHESMMRYSSRRSPMNNIGLF